MWKSIALLFIIILLGACSQEAVTPVSTPASAPPQSITENTAHKATAIPTEKSNEPETSKPLETGNPPETNNPPTTNPDSGPKPTSKPKNGALDKFKEQGYKVEEKQIFTRKFEEIGELTVTPVTKFGESKEFPLSLILTGGDKEIVLTPDREDRHALYSSFAAISFKDIDDYSLKTGYTDIVVIANFVTGAGEDGAKPFSDLFIFKNDSWGSFVEDTKLEKRIMRASNSRMLTMKQVFDLAKPVDVKSFVGRFTENKSNKYAESTITIKSINQNKIKFDLDAFHVIGGDEGVRTGNVNLGNIEDGEATVDGYIATYKPEGFNFILTFEFFPNDTFQVTEKGDSIFGMGVSASGLYKRNK